MVELDEAEPIQQAQIHNALKCTSASASSRAENTHAHTTEQVLDVFAPHIRGKTPQVETRRRCCHCGLFWSTETTATTVFFVPVSRDPPRASGAWQGWEERWQDGAQHAHQVRRHCETLPMATRALGRRRCGEAAWDCTCAHGPLSRAYAGKCPCGKRCALPRHRHRVSVTGALPRKRAAIQGPPRLGGEALHTSAHGRWRHARLCPAHRLHKRPGAQARAGTTYMGRCQWPTRRKPVLLVLFWLREPRA